LCGLLLSQQRHAGMITAPGDHAYCAPRRKGLSSRQYLRGRDWLFHW
jgi:hypothetical protein